MDRVDGNSTSSRIEETFKNSSSWMAMILKVAINFSGKTS
jgi:hypothetical protein